MGEISQRMELGIFFLEIRGVIWSFRGGSIWLLTEETNRLDGSAR